MFACAGPQLLLSQVSSLNSLVLKTDFLPLTFFLKPEKKKKNNLLKHKTEGIVEQSQVGLRYDYFWDLFLSISTF